MTGVTRAPVVPLNVVACRKPGQWIVRAMSPFTDPRTLVKAVQTIVGRMDPTLEWTGYSYEGWPGYVVYGKGDLSRHDWPTGVFRFDCLNPNTYADVYGEAVYLREVDH